jgi:WD40 repeat protein
MIKENIDCRSWRGSWIVAAIAVLLWLSQRGVSQEGATKPAATAALQSPLPARCLAFSPDGKSLAVTHSADQGGGRLVVWNLDTKQPRFIRQPSGLLLSVDYSQKGDLLAVGGFMPEAWLLDPLSGQLKQALKGHENHVRSVAFRPNHNQLATGSYDRTARLWDLEHGKVLRVFSGHADSLRGIAVSPDGKWLASAGGIEDAARLWNLENENEPPRAFIIDGFVPQVTFSADSRTLAVSTWGGGPRLIDVATGDDADYVTGMGSVYWTAYSPDGKWLAIAAQDSRLGVFPLPHKPSSEEERRIAAQIEQFNDDDYAKREAASRRLAEIGGAAVLQLRAGLDSKSAEVRVRCRRILERMMEREFARNLAGHLGELQCLAFSPDSSRLASGDWQGVVKIWDVATWKNVTNLSYSGE